jgi:hypothetical protein
MPSARLRSGGALVWKAGGTPRGRSHDTATRCFSDVGFLGDLQRVVDLDSEVAHSRLYALVPKRLGFILRIS